MIFLICVYAFGAFPGYWVSETDILGRNQGEHPVTSFVDKFQCERQGEGPCYSIENCPPHICKLVNGKMVEDAEMKSALLQKEMLIKTNQQNAIDELKKIDSATTFQDLKRALKALIILNRSQ